MVRETVYLIEEEGGVEMWPRGQEFNAKSER